MLFSLGIGQDKEQVLSNKEAEIIKRMQERRVLHVESLMLMMQLQMQVSIYGIYLIIII